MATIHLPTHETTEKLVSAALWTAQVVLASVFAVDGIINLSAPLERLVEVTPWVASVPAAVVRIFGALEVLGAVSLMLPTSSRALTCVAGGAAAAFAVLVGANLASRAQLASPGALALEVTLLVVTALVAWERLRVHHEQTERSPH
ncbi:MAG: DoxX family protein [Polyangiales bacterium]